MTRIVAIDPGKLPSARDRGRTAFVVAVAHLLKSLAECENLPQPVTDAIAEVKGAVDGLYAGAS